MPAKQLRWSLCLAFLMAMVLPLLSPGLAQAQSPQSESVPPELEPWVEWVRQQERPPGNCRNHEGVTICVWPTQAALRLEQTGGSFSLEVAVSEADTVELIGSDDAWPQSVRVDGKPALIIDGGGVPEVQVEAGQHRIEGRFAWRELPDQLYVPEAIAMVELVVEGVEITFPDRSGTVLDIPVLEREPEEEEAPAEEEPTEEQDAPAEPEPDTERVEVSRLLTDGVPLSVTTRIDLRVSGQDRELQLPYPLWEDAKLVRIDSNLPVSLDEEQHVVVKLCPGTHYVTLTAELPRAPESLGPPSLDAPWPDSEVWVWQTNDAEGAASLGQVALSGGSPVDRTRTHAPESWPEGATYTVGAKTPLRFEVLQRGVAESAPNQISLSREAIFDLAGEGWYFRDTIAGTMNSSSRLDLETGQLGSVIVDDQPQVITVNSEGKPGVELRNPELSLLAQWRHSSDANMLPLSGWSETFEGAKVEFKLPRGWDLLYVSGPGRTSTTWLERWNPLHAILLLGACFAIGFWADRRAALAALVGLVLLFSASDDGFVPLLVLLVVLAGLPRVLQRPSLSPWVALGVRSAWLLGVFVLLAWIIMFLPENLVEVWRFGAPALGQLRIEGADEQLTGLAATALMLAGLVAGVSWVMTHLGRLGLAKGSGGKVAIALIGFIALAGLGLTLTTLGDREADYAVTAAEAPPPAEEYDREEEQKVDADKNGLYAMRGPSNSEQAKMDEDVWGGLTGEDVGEAYGVGGLGLVGTGRGGGGTGEGTIGLGNTGLIGKGGGGGSGYGRGSGAGFGGRGKRVPQVRQAKAKILGNYDSDVTRRVVRAHINEVRSCYNTGLEQNTELEGRIAINFAINADGKVGSAVVEESTLADAAVGKCIAKAVKRWKFPAPESGNEVIVTYPFVLSSGGASNKPGSAGLELGQEPDEPTRYVSSEELPEAPPPEIPQTGEAKPDWNGRLWTVEVERRVEQGEALQLYLLSPLTNKLIALLRALALASMALLVLFAGWGPLLTPPVDTNEDDVPDGEQDSKSDTGRDPAPDPDPPYGDGTPGRSAGVTLAVLLLSLAAPNVASAAPPQSLLDELEERINEERELAPSPDCEDACALVPLLEVRVSSERLSLESEVHMEAPGVYTIPGPLSAWAPSELSIDGKPAKAVVAYDNKLLVRMDAGIHRVVASGPIAGEELNLSLHVQPKRVELEIDNQSWKITGIDPNDTATNLQFLREDEPAPDPENEGVSVSEPDPEDPEDPESTSEDEGVSEQARDDSKGNQELPLWLSVEREIEIGPRWTMRTTVRRVNAGDTPAKIQVPLLEGEQMIESSRVLEDPKATLTLERGDDVVTWTSVLDPRERLVLAAPAGDAEGGPKWTESWTFVCGAAWQCNAEGVAPSSRSGSRSVYYPWPGETLEVALFKPTPAEGARLSVDAASLNLEIGEEGTSATLEAMIRTSTVGERTITIPESAHLEAVRVDGKDIPTSKDSAAIRLTFQPGVHQLYITWKQDEGWSTSYATPKVSLGGAAINTSVTVSFSDERSPIYLRTSGTGFGPSVWLWAWLLALLAVALLLHRLNADKRALGPHDWFLLGFGFPLAVMPLVAAWFLSIGQRRRLVGASPSEQRYNMVQLGIGLLTVLVALLALLTARMLLTQPIDTMAQNFYGDELLGWYLDRTDDAMPEGHVLSVPASLWRVLGIAWVGWFGWRSVAWFKWAKAELSEGGWMRWPAPIVIADEDDEPLSAPEQLEAASAEATAPASESVVEARVTQLEPEPTDPALDER